VETKPLYSWDEAKRAINVAKHGVDFAAANDFDWDFAHIEIDDREDYGELREIAWGFIGVQLHVLVYTRREDELIWIISLRKAERRDVKKYEEAIRKWLG